MKIGIDIRHLATDSPSGVGLYTLALIREMAKKSPADVFLLLATGCSATLEKIPKFTEPNVQAFASPLPNKIVSSALLSKKITLEGLLPIKPDVWWFPNLNIINTRLPYVITAHDLSFKFYPEFFTAKTRLWHRVCNPAKLYREAKQVLAVSKSTKKDLLTSFDLAPENITVTPLGFDPNIYGPREQSFDHQFRLAHGLRWPYFLSLCTREPRKNLGLVVEAYSTWRRRVLPRPTPVFSSVNRRQPGDPRVVSPLVATETPKLVIAGGRGWKSGALNRAIRSSWFRDDIYVLDYVPEKHKASLYRGASAFIFPSFYEGFGLPVLEAMACGTPVISSFTSSLPEVVGASGLLIDPYRSADLVAALSLIEKTGTREKLRALGLAQSKNFSWGETAQLTLQSLHS